MVFKSQGSTDGVRGQYQSVRNLVRTNACGSLGKYERLLKAHYVMVHFFIFELSKVFKVDITSEEFKDENP